MPKYTFKLKNVPGLVIPKRADSLSSGYDIISTSDPEIVGEEIQPNVYKNIQYIQYHTNLFIDATDSFYSKEEDENGTVEVEYDTRFHTLIYPRSSISKYNLILANSTAIIDNNFRGEILLRFKYFFQPSDVIFLDPQKHPSFGISVDQSKIYQKGDKCAQLLFQEITPNISFELVDELEKTERNAGAFGSTGK